MPSDDHAFSLHPAFGLADETDLRLAERWGAQAGVQEALHFFSASVARDHLNLRAHVQRILLLVDRKMGPSQTMGAMLDLFLALGDKGLSLRTLLLAQAEPCLSADDAAFLRQHLAEGLQRLDPLPSSQGSLFDHAISGSTQIVVREKAVREQDVDAVDLAIMHLEHGDVASAREVLEQAIVAQPNDPAINNELLEIYRRSRDQAGFQTMRKTLLQKGVSLGTEWDEL